MLEKKINLTSQNSQGVVILDVLIRLVSVFWKCFSQNTLKHLAKIFTFESVNISKPLLVE